jgi:membrane-associated protease RseP (regulator of RpoE activity)
MRKYVVASIVVLPLLLSFSHATQSWPVDPPEQITVFSSEEGGTASYLGVDISDVSTERLSALKLKEEKGVEVTMVDQDAPAGKAGIKEHDVILSMNGTAIESGAQLRRMIHETPPGRIVTFGLSRDGQPMTVKVQLADKGKEFSYMNGHNMKNFNVHVPEIHIPDIDIPSINMVMVTSSARSGLSVENITPQLGEFFGVKNGNGVLVRAVEKGSRAEKAGFRAGDVIVKINDQPVHDTGDFTHAVRSRKGAAVSVGVIRDKKEQNLNLTLPERKESGVLLEDEESLEGPLIDGKFAFDWSELKEKVADQMALASENARTSARELCKDLYGQKKVIQQQVEKLKNQSLLEQKELKKDQEKLRIQLNRVLQEPRRHWLDI